MEVSSKVSFNLKFKQYRISNNLKFNLMAFSLKHLKFTQNLCLVMSVVIMLILANFTSFSWILKDGKSQTHGFSFM